MQNNSYQTYRFQKPIGLTKQILKFSSGNFILWKPLPLHRSHNILCAHIISHP
jgi:hypothetical protein